MSGGSIRILWDESQPCEVTITGGIASWTVNSATATFPHTVSSSTTFTTSHAGTYTLSVKYAGMEIADTPDGVRTVELINGEELIFSPSPDNANAVAVGLDSIVASHVDDPTSATRESLSAVYTLKGEVPTLEEQALSVVLDPGSITTTQTRRVYVAPFSCSVDQIAFAFGAAVAASDTDYWTVTLTRYRAGVAAGMGSKTTRTTASGGEAIAANAEWHFDLLTLSNTGFLKGDILAVTMTPTGAPDALSGPCLTLRAPAADVAPDPATLASDAFNRADAGSLGTADSGQAWANLISSWSIVGNQAVPAAAGGRKAVAIDAAVSDCTVQAKIAVKQSNSDGLVVRATDGSNCFFVTSSSLQKFEGGVLSTVSSYSATALSGDSLRAVLSGDSITIYRDAGSTGAWTAVLGVTHAFNATATKHGLYSADTTSTARFDDFRVTE